MARFDNPPPPPSRLKGNALATLVRIFVLAAFIVTAVQSSATAAWTDLQVHNNTGRIISKLYLSQAGHGTWGQNIIRGQLWNGFYHVVRYDNSFTYFDLRIIFSDGQEITWQGGSRLNLSGAWKINIYKSGSHYSVSKN